MILREVRGQFTIFIFMANSDANVEVKGALVEAGYESFLFADQDTLLSRIKEAAPHVILFSPEALLTPLSEFVTQVLELNSEIQFACVASVAEAQALKDYQEYNFSALVVGGEGAAARAVWSLDLICEMLYRTYQNEDLIAKLEKLEIEAKLFESATQQELTALKISTTALQEFSISEKMRLYDDCQSKDDYLTTFLTQLPVKGLFFKFLPTVSSFVATFAQGLDIESLKGVGSRMSAAESKDVQGFLAQGEIPAALHELMKEGLKVDKYFSKVVQVPHGIEGLFLLWGGPDFNVAEIENDFLVFQMLYQQAYLMKRNEGLDIYDPTTELLNRSQFYKKLDEEIARARRLEKPISVVRLSVDHLMEIEQSFGRSNRDLILRTIASIIKRTSRVNDYSCRTEENIFSLILPHCARRGAALRAERLRRIIESHSFAVSDLKITVSCGVSEYPSLATGASDLDVSAGMALEFIVGRGGNKVCLYKPVQEFKPDFEVPPA